MPTSPFTTVASTDLDAVTGGRTASTSRAATDERLMDKLQSITVAIKDVAAQQAQGQKPDAMSSMMPIVAMSMMKKNRV